MFNETSIGLGNLGDACDQYLPQIYATADRYGIDRGIALAQIKQESGCNPNATGPSTRYGTARGMAQFIDSTFAQWGASGQSPYDPEAALDAWGAYMRDLLNSYGGDYSLALAAYNAGPGNVDKYDGVPPFKQTTNYVANIMKALGIGNSTVAQSDQDWSSSDTDTLPPFETDTLKWFGVGAIAVAVYFLLR